MKTQRLEELAIKQSRQLIPVTPSMPKALVRELPSEISFFSFFLIRSYFANCKFVLFTIVKEFHFFSYAYFPLVHVSFYLLFYMTLCVGVIIPSLSSLHCK